MKVDLVTTFILPLIDYRNITFICASQIYNIKLPKLLNSAVRFVFNLSRKMYRLHVTAYMKNYIYY